MIKKYDKKYFKKPIFLPFFLLEDPSLPLTRCQFFMNVFETKIVDLLEPPALSYARQRVLAMPSSSLNTEAIWKSGVFHHSNFVVRASSHKANVRKSGSKDESLVSERPPFAAMLPERGYARTKAPQQKYMHSIQRIGGRDLCRSYALSLWSGGKLAVCHRNS